MALEIIKKITLPNVNLKSTCIGENACIILQELENVKKEKLYSLIFIHKWGNIEDTKTLDFETILSPQTSFDFALYIGEQLSNIFEIPLDFDFIFKKNNFKNKENKKQEIMCENGNFYFINFDNDNKNCKKIFVGEKNINISSQNDFSFSGYIIKKENNGFYMKISGNVLGVLVKGIFPISTEKELTTKEIEDNIIFHKISINIENEILNEKDIIIFPQNITKKISTSLSYEWNKRLRFKEIEDNFCFFEFPIES